MGLIVRTWIAAAVAMAGMPLAQDPTPYPTVGKKGLQVQMTDDALALGLGHALVECDLAELIDLDGGADATPFVDGGRTWHFTTAALQILDRRIAPLARKGIVVTVQLLAARSTKALQARCVLHPDQDPGGPRSFCAFDSVTPDGKAFLRAAARFLATRWLEIEGRGRVWNWIVGSEVNAHWDWYNMGRCSPERAIEAYEQAIRIVHGAVTSVSANARVYVGLGHRWTSRPNVDQMLGIAARDFLDRFASLVHERGDFGWHLALRPTSEDPFDPRFWNGIAASDEADTPLVTLRNLPVLMRHLASPDLAWRGQPRRVLLDAVTFHCGDGRNAEELQAAAFAAAWQIVQQIDGIDAMILRRQVDHRHDGGLRCGLWARKSGSTADPERQRSLWTVFRAAGTAEWQQTVAFALPILRLQNWQQLTPAVHESLPAQPPR
ncbi:MAG: hypothetical protein IPK26_00265 [Planctomycetes bacterium]|nr:hypothetical protein [Planctomycetota bacterium]